MPRALRVVDRAHLVYLGSLPPLATFSLLYTYGFGAPFIILFVAGTAAVGAYLAITYVYTPLPRSLAAGLLQLLDGPAWALLSLALKGGRPLAFAVGGFIVDGTAIWASVLLLAARSSLPTREQRRASIAFMLAALASSLWLAWPYLRDTARGGWGAASIFLLGLGAAQGALTRYRLLGDEEVQRPSAESTAYIVVFIIAWAAALIAGNVLHELAPGARLIR